MTGQARQRLTLPMIMITSDDIRRLLCMRYIVNAMDGSGYGKHRPTYTHTPNGIIFDVFALHQQEFLLIIFIFFTLTYHTITTRSTATQNGQAGRSIYRRSGIEIFPIRRNI